MFPFRFKKALVFYCLPLAILSFLQLAASAQMRQIYLDADSTNTINKLSFYAPNEGYAAFEHWIGYTTDSGKTFTKLYITIANVNVGNYPVNYTLGFGIAGVKAFDKNTLIVYGDYGFVPSILYSTDGGNSFTLIFWSQVTLHPDLPGITDIVFPQNDNIGYAIDADRILKTTDKGVTCCHEYPASYEQADQNIQRWRIMAEHYRTAPPIRRDRLCLFPGR
jgi:hypothetical protein